MRISERVTWVGAMDPNLRVFDVVIPTDWGTTYNSYLIKAEKPAVIDTVKADFAEEFLFRLKQEVNLRALSYLVVNHTEPDHSGAVPRLLDLAPEVTVYGSKAAIRFLKEQVNRPFKSQIVGHNDTLNLGDRTLRFISTPFLHWPDTMFTYLEEEEILFTCDAFGAHYSDPDQRMWASEMGGHMEHVKYYYDSIMSPFKPKILDATRKTRQLNLRLIAPGHGPILDEELWSYVDAYEKWSTETDGTREKRILVTYASAYGNTKAMAEAILKGITSVPGVEGKIYDLGQLQTAEMAKITSEFDGILIGSPTMNADAVEPAWRLLSHINPIKAKGKLAAVFGNYGWSGEAVSLLEKRLHDMRLAVAQPGLRVLFTPTDDDLKACRNWGRDFASALVGEQNLPELSAG